MYTSVSSGKSYMHIAIAIVLHLVWYLCVVCSYVAKYTKGKTLEEIERHFNHYHNQYIPLD